MSAAYAFEDLQDPAFDLGIRIGRVSDDRLVARCVGQFRRVVVASPGYLARHPLGSLDALADARCVIFSDRKAAATWTLISGGGAAAEERRIAVSGRLAVRSIRRCSASPRARNARRHCVIAGHFRTEGAVTPGKPGRNRPEPRFGWGGTEPEQPCTGSMLAADSAPGSRLSTSAAPRCVAAIVWSENVTQTNPPEWWTAESGKPWNVH